MLNAGVSTVRALRPAAVDSAEERVLLHYTDLRTVSGSVVPHISQQAGGSHADEIETSMMLYIAPELVDMDKAADHYHPADRGLTRNPQGRGTYSATGIYGDATLATRAKGEQVVEAMVTGMLQDIEILRNPSPESGVASIRE